MIWFGLIGLIWFDLIWYEHWRKIQAGKSDWFYMIKHNRALIWFDLVWFNLVWFDLIWFDLSTGGKYKQGKVIGLIWLSTTWLWFDLIWFDLVWVWFGLIWFDLIWALEENTSREKVIDLIWLSTTGLWFDLIWSGLIGLIWFDLIWALYRKGKGDLNWPLEENTSREKWLILSDWAQQGFDLFWFSLDLNLFDLSTGGKSNREKVDLIWFDLICMACGTSTFSH